MVDSKRQDDLLDGLVVDARAGRPGAFTRLWEALGPAVAGYLRGRGVQDSDVATSEVFLGAFRALDTPVTTGDDFRRQLFRFAHLRCTVDLRARRDAAGGDMAELLATCADAVRALTRDTARDTVAMLQRLPDDQRNVLLLRVVAGLSVSDIAAVLDRPTDSVRQLHQRALARLRREVAREGAHVPVGTRPGTPVVFS